VVSLTDRLSIAMIVPSEVTLKKLGSWFRLKSEKTISATGQRFF
jgi:hypothetical protein